MTAYKLQTDLKEELQNIFSGDAFKTPYQDETGADQYSKLNIYPQSLPLRNNNDQEEDEDPYPYIIVRIDSGNMIESKANKVKIRMLIGIYDEDKDTNGHLDVMNIIQKIYERFAKNPLLADKYIMLNDSENPFEWVLQDDDTYPYYFGAIEATWATSAIRRESKYT